MKDDRVHLSDILDRIERIKEYTRAGRKAFASSPLIQDAVIRNFEVISEATKKISRQPRERHPQIPWRRMAGFRDVLIHDYDRLILQEVWGVIENDLVSLKAQLTEILKSLEAGGDPPPGTKDTG